MARFPDKVAARRSLRLRPYAPTVLLAGGGDGTEPLGKYAAALAQSRLDVQVLAVCGRNAALARRIREENHAGVHVFGFVDNMPELMRASDVVVSKAGPGAIAEALTTGLPIILTGYLPGQETPNVEFVVRSGIGLYAPKSEQLLEGVQRILAEGGSEWRSMADRAAAIARPYAALDIAREALALAGRYRYNAASQASR